MTAWRLDSSWVLLPGAPFCDGLLEEYSVSPVLFVKESFWPVEFRQAPLAHKNNKITRRAGDAEDSSDNPSQNGAPGRRTHEECNRHAVTCLPALPLSPRPADTRQSFSLSYQRRLEAVRDARKTRFGLRSGVAWCT